VDVYPLIKALHVACVIVWIGGDFALLVLSTHRLRSGAVTEFVRFLPDVMVVTRYVAIPSSLVAVACGLTMAFMSWGFGELWILIGLAGFATVFGNGVVFLRPQTERLMALAGQDRPPAELAWRASRLLRFVESGHVVMFLVVADMVLKPGFGDTGTWLAMLVVLAVAGALIWRPAVRTR
jgi:uncharacterized membrane protein